MLYGLPRPLVVGSDGCPNRGTVGAQQALIFFVAHLIDEMAQSFATFAGKCGLQLAAILHLNYVPTAIGK